MITITAVFLLLSNLLFSQNFIGIHYSPYWTLNNSFAGIGVVENRQDKFTYGYSVGIQGLTMTNRRISFSYGLQYVYQNLNNPYYYDFTDLNDPLLTAQGRKEELYTIELPATWRYNFVKEGKLQPYISLSTTILIPISQKATITGTDGNRVEGELNYTPFILPDFGVGLNYKTENWLFNIQPTVRPFSIWKKVGVGFSVMKKF